MYIRVSKDVTIRLDPVRQVNISLSTPYEMVVDDNWGEIVIGLDLKGIQEFADCLEEFLNEEADRGQSGPDSTTNRLPA